MPVTFDVHMNGTRMPLLQRAEMQRLVAKGLVCKSKSSYTIPNFEPKKDGSWRIYVSGKAINKITIKYKLSVPHPNDTEELAR